MGLFSSILGIAGGIVGAIYGGPAGAAAGSAIGGGIGGAVEGGGSSAQTAQPTSGWAGAATTVGNAIPGVVAGMTKQDEIERGAQQSQYAIDMQVQGTQQTNAQNLAEAQRNRDFQERMSSTAHQRQVADFRAAGLNPILSAMGGSGATTASGSMATSQNPYEGMAGNVNEARKIKEIAAAQLQQEQQRIQNENKLADSAVSLNKAKAEESLSSKTLNEEASYLKILEMNTELERTAKTRQEREELMSRVNLNNAYTAKAYIESRLAKLRGDHENLSLKERDYLSPLKKWTGPAREIFNSAEDAVDVINPFNSKTIIHRNP